MTDTTPYHWDNALMRQFLDHLATSGLVQQSARAVGMSPRAAYDQRHRHRAFRIGWAAATLLARDILTDQLLEQALIGREVTVTRQQIDADTVQITRHVQPTRLAMALLARFDRQAAGEDAGPDNGFARRAASHWGDYLADLFGSENPAPRALAKWLGAHDALDLACEVAQISAVSEHCAALAAADAAASPLGVDDFELWYEPIAGQWMTNLPPVDDDWLGLSGGRAGHSTYWRTLDVGEDAIVAARTATPVRPATDDIAAAYARIFAADGAMLRTELPPPIRRSFPADTPHHVLNMIDHLAARFGKAA